MNDRYQVVISRFGTWLDPQGDVCAICQRDTWEYLIDRLDKIYRAMPCHFECRAKHTDNELVQVWEAYHATPR